MKSCLKGCLSFFLISLALAMFFTLASLSHNGTEWIEDSFWAPEITSYDSETRIVPVWGYPLGIIIDHPTIGLRGRIDRADSIYWANTFINFTLWWFVAILAYGIYCITRVLQQGRTTQPNALN